MRNITLKYVTMKYRGIEYVAFNAVGAGFTTNAKDVETAKERLDKFLKRKKKRK